jgi:NTE family protein
MLIVGSLRLPGLATSTTRSMQRARITTAGRCAPGPAEALAGREGLGTPSQCGTLGRRSSSRSDGIETRRESNEVSAKATLGLVLSGGGARGISHIGVIEALRSRGLEPDCIAGSSSGAIIGALAAAGHSTQTMLEFFQKASPFRLSVVTVVKPGILDTAKVVASFREYFPDDSFEALTTRLFLTATDITNARLKIFESGPLIPAILASCSMPLVFTPTEVDGRWYVDGGVINNFPIEPVRGRCDVVVGHYASPLRGVKQTDLSGVLAVSLRALEVGMHFTSKQKFHECDVMLSCPQLNEYSLFDTKHHLEIFEAGRRATLDAMDSIERAMDAVA